MNQFLRCLSLASLVTFFAVPAALGQRELLPVDQAASQSDFFTFRAQLQTAIARRDVPAILSVVHKDIKNSYGGDDGFAEFKEMWAIEKPNSLLWESLAAVLALGGTFEKDGTFVAPYLFSRWPEGIDAFEHIAVVGSGVRVRSAPRTSSPVLATVSFAILETVEPGPDAPWVSVRLPTGKIGHIDRKYVRSAIDYRAVFKKSDGRWQMTVLIAGD